MHKNMDSVREGLETAVNIKGHSADKASALNVLLLRVISREHTGSPHSEGVGFLKPPFLKKKNTRLEKNS